MTARLFRSIPRRNTSHRFHPHLFLSALTVAASAVLSVLVCSPSQAQPSSLTGTFFKVPGNHPDFNRGTQDSANVSGLVETFLGLNGLPVRSNKGKTFPGPNPPLGPSGPITDVNAQNEILWWSDSSSITNHAVFEKTQITLSPFAFDDFFPDGQLNDNTFLRAVHFQGTFVISSPQTVTFISNVDDELFGYVDGNLVIDSGGIVHRPIVTTNLTNLAAGQHKLDLFYDDREVGGAGFHFSSNVTLTATASAPEPASLALLLPILGVWQFFGGAAKKQTGIASRNGKRRVHPHFR